MRAAAGALALALAACGGSGEKPEPRWTPGEAVKPLPGDPRAVPSRDAAEAVIKHQMQDHCSKQLIEVRCLPRADAWNCEYRTNTGLGEVQIPRQAPDGIPLGC